MHIAILEYCIVSHPQAPVQIFDMSTRRTTVTLTHPGTNTPVAYLHIATIQTFFPARLQNILAGNSRSQRKLFCISSRILYKRTFWSEINLNYSIAVKAIFQQFSYIELCFCKEKLEVIWIVIWILISRLVCDSGGGDI